MFDWSTQRIEQLAPDAAAVKAAQSTAKPAKWQNLGSDDRLIWGECQGSGANPYQVRIDLIDVTYKCSCPSRKLPCKHTLALLMMFATGVPIQKTAPPAYVAEWSANRAKRAEAKQAREAQPAAPPDPEARAKRLEKREARIGAGLDQLEIWMSDIVTHGLAATRAQNSSFWSQMASRLIDSQAPGLARRVRELGERAVASAQWQSELLAGLAQLQLLIDAYRHASQLPHELAQEIRTIVGWTQEQAELREREGVRDQWHVIARRQFEDETLRTQVTWLHGPASSRFALLLEFAVGAQPLPASYSVGQVIDAELVFFDGCPAMRALEKERHGSGLWQLQLPAAYGIVQMQTAFAALVATNPWLERYPIVLGAVRPRMRAGALYLRDEEGREVRVDPSCKHGWTLVALAGGSALKIFGEWNGTTFDPYTIEQNGGLFTLARLNDIPFLSRVA